MAGKLVTTGLGKWNLADSSQNALSGNLYDTKAIGAFNRTMGGLASIGVSYAGAGSASANLLNTSMFGLQDVNEDPVSIGLLEYHFGKMGNYLALGMEGTDMNVLQMLQSFKGMGETISVSSFKLGGVEGRDTLSALNGLGWSNSEANWLLAQNIKSGSVQITYEDLGGELGRTKQSNANMIYLNEMLLGGGEEGAAQIASVLAHEGMHVGGSADEAAAYIQSWETFNDLKDIWQVSGEGHELTGIAAMAQFYSEKDARLAMMLIAAQGLLDQRQEGIFSEGAALDPRRMQELVALYGYRDGRGELRVDPRVIQSEQVRRKHQEGKALSETDLEAFIQGESVRLGMDAARLRFEVEQRLEIKEKLERSFELASTAELQTIKELKSLGIDLGKGGLEQWVSSLEHLLVDNGYLKRTVDYAAGKVVGDLTGVPGAWDILKSKDEQEAAEALFKGLVDKGIDKLLTEAFGDKVPGVAEIRYLAKEIMMTSMWSGEVLSAGLALNQIDDYKAYLKSQWSYSDTMRIDVTMQNLAAVEYLQNLLTSGTAMEMLKAHAQRFSRGLITKVTYGGFLDLGEWTAKMKYPYSMKDSLSEWVRVSPGIDFKRRIQGYNLGPGENLYLYLKLLDRSEKFTKYQTFWSWEDIR